MENIVEIYKPVDKVYEEIIKIIKGKERNSDV